MNTKQTWILLRRDRMALAAAIFLVMIFLCAFVGSWMLGEQASAINLRVRNSPPLNLDQGWLYVLGSDSLGRSILARLVVASRITIGIAIGVVVMSMCAGAALGMIAGLSSGIAGQIIMRVVDVIMSFPSLLLALIVLYVLGPSAINIVIVLAIARVPIYIRTTRAAVLEIRERPFVSAARVLGADDLHIAIRHIVPLVLPMLFVIGALDFAYVMLAESSLSFLGLGVQPPAVTWGLMVAEGRSYLSVAWWLSFWPGLMIMITAIAANLLAMWFRMASDPSMRTLEDKMATVHV